MSEVNTVKVGEQTVNFKNIKAGLRLEDIQDPQLKTIFQKYSGEDNVLSQDEINKMIRDLQPFMDHGKITKREMKKFIKQQNLQGITHKNMNAFIQALSDKSDRNVKLLQQEGLDAEKLHEEVKSEKNVTTYYFDAEKTKKAFEYEESESGYKYTVYQEGETRPKKEVKYANGSGTTTTEYEENKTTITYTGDALITSNNGLTKKEVEKQGTTIKTTETYAASATKTTEETDDKRRVTTVDVNGNTTNVSEVKVNEEWVPEPEVKAEEPKQEPEKKTFQDVFESGKKVTVDESGSTARITAKGGWDADVRVMGEYTDNGLPKEIRVQLPAVYNGSMKLKLADETNGVYSDSRGIRHFQMNIGEDGSITLKQIHYENNEISEDLQADSLKIKRSLERRVPAPEEKRVHNAEETVQNKLEVTITSGVPKAEDKKEGEKIATNLKRVLASYDTNSMSSVLQLREYLAQIDKNNAAYVIEKYSGLLEELLKNADDTKFGTLGINKEDILTDVLRPLAEQHKIYCPDKDPKDIDKYIETLRSKDTDSMKEEAIRLASNIKKSENQLVSAASKAFETAGKTLTEAAANPDKLEISSTKYNNKKTATLNDGRTIEVCYNFITGDIMSIVVGDVIYSNFSDKATTKWKNTSGTCDFNKLKELVEKIFPEEA